MSNELKYYFPWVRKGLKEGVTEEDQLGKIENADSLNKLRSSIKISADYKITSPAGSAESLPVPLSKEIQIVGPGDILRVSTKAILKTVPVRGHQRFRKDFYPYIEFWEPDFPWRYTPVVPNNNKLRPWLALLVCKTDDCMIDKSNERSTVSFNISNQQQYEHIFISPEDIWKTAHAQGMSQAEPEFSRLIALRRKNPKEPKEEEHKYYLEEDTNYVALLVPSFETGRLRGLGYDDETLKDIVAQMPAWEKTLEDQKIKHPLKPLDFPVYYQWNFKTGGDSFVKLAEDLKFAAGFESGVDIDVSRMGNGFDYNKLDPVLPGSKRRNILRMPAAVTTAGIKDNPFPSATIDDEVVLYRNLKKLMDKNPVLAENRAEIEGDSMDEIGDDDPWVTPPLYGAKHIMATGIKDLGAATSGGSQQPPPLDEPPRWLSQVNLDVHYRAVAGLGKRTVQIHQEEFVNRAWKQVEAVNALNCELYQRLVSVNASDALKNKVFSPGEPKDAKYLARLMRYLGSMKNASLNGGPSLKNILKNSNIPSAFAAASFQNMADELAKKVPALNNTTLMENIAKNQIYSNMPDLDHAMTGIRQLYSSKPYKVPLNNNPPVPIPHYIFNQDQYLPHTFVVAVCDEFWKKLQKGNLSKYFNFEVRKPNWGDEDNDIRSLYALKLKPISHNESDINKPDYIYAPDYKLLRYNNFFKALLNEWTLQWNFHVDKPRNFVNKSSSTIGPRLREATTFLNQDELKKEIYLDIYKKIGEFLKSEKDKHHCYGHTTDRVRYSEKTIEAKIDNYYGDRALPKESLGSNASNIIYSYKMKRRCLDKPILGVPNVLVLSDEDFCKVFPSYLINSIVRVGGKEHCYIIPKRLLKKYSWNAIRLFVRLPDSFSGRDINIADNYIEAQVVYQNEEYEYSDENIKCIETVQYTTTTPPQTRSLNAEVPFLKPRYKASEGRSYREVPVLIDPVAPGSSQKPQKLQLFTGGYGRYCYHHTQLYYPLLWRILELWKKGGATDYFCTTLVDNIRPLWGISPVVPKSQKGAFMLNIRGHYHACNNCASATKTQCFKKGFAAQCIDNFMYIEKIHSCEQKISKYLFEQPDRVELDVKAFTDQGGKIVHYEGYHFAYETIQKLKRDPEKPTEYKLFKPWYELHKRSMELNAKIDKIQAKKQAAVTVTSQEDEDKDNDVKTWIDNADQSALYEQMIKVAKSYYAEFFADTPEGKKLQDNYIEELLHTKYPIMAYPIFPEPVYYYLKMFSDKFLMPCVDELPEDSVAMFLTNPAFTEAYLCGMNTEMAKELLWREYPTDQRGSYFRKFWDSETSVADIHNENFFDVKPLHTWTSGDLGAHHMESKTGLILFIIRGKLMKQFPSTQVFLHKAKGTYNAVTKDGTILFDKDAPENERILKPEIQAYIREDIFLVGFKKEFKDALGDPEQGRFGYFLTFMEDVQDLNFEDKDTSKVSNAADAANTLINEPTLYGKHLSLFLNVK